MKTEKKLLLVNKLGDDILSRKIITKRKYTEDARTMYTNYQGINIC